MSFGVIRKKLKCLGISGFLLLALPSLSGAQQGCAHVGVSFGVPCGVGCNNHHCPPPYKYCVEGPPRICWQHGCPRPICNPCDLPHWGFYETCWNPWPFPPEWTHCPSPPPAAQVTLDPYVHPNLPPPERVLKPGAGLQAPDAAPSPSFPGPKDADSLRTPNGGVEEVPLLPLPRRLEGKRPELN